MAGNVLSSINYGIYVVSSVKDGKYNGQIVNTVFQVSAEPPCVAVCLNKKNLTHEYIRAAKVFSVSILEKEAPMLYIGKFGFKSGRDIDKFKDTKNKTGKTGAPVALDYALGYFECEVISETEALTHTIFLGKVVAEEKLAEGKEALTYEYYRQVKKGKSPATAPTYVKEERVSNTVGEIKTKGNYKCTVCDYIYEQGKDGNSLPFLELAKDWVCPVCKAGKDKFVKES